MAAKNLTWRKRPAGRPSALLAFLAAASVAMADEYTWVGGSSVGGWSVAANWVNVATQRPECPKAGDIAVFNDPVTNVVTDADAALACSLKLIRLNNYSFVNRVGVRLVFDLSGDFEAACAIRGAGDFVKRGRGTLSFSSGNRDGLQGAYGFWPVYSVDGGSLTVEEGALAMPTGKDFGYLVSSLAVSNGASFYLPGDRAMCLCGLSGDGDVALPGTATADAELQIGHPGSRAPSVFAGRLLRGDSGKRFSVLSYAPLCLLGEASDCTSVTGLKYRGVEADGHGRISARKLGPRGTPSSVGLGDVGMEWCGGFAFVGEGPDETDRAFAFDFRSDDGRPCAAVLDGGAHGGLTFAGPIVYRNAGDKGLMGVLVLQGSNAVPCVIAGDFSGTFATADGPRTVAIVKKGPGAWRFAERGAARTQRGVYEIREGTLQFESIAEAGEACSLGLSTLRQVAEVGAYDPAGAVGYAFSLGGETSADAVLEYCGAAPAACATRPLALAGNGRLRANGAANAPLDFAGVSVLSPGARTLVLDGTNTAENVVRDVTDGARGGVLSVVKDGPGTWRLKGRQTFSGDVSVRGGTLVVSHSPVTPYRWFRVTFPDGYAQKKVWYLYELALYDADGVRRNAGLSLSRPEGAPETGPCGGWRPDLLAPGSATYADAINYYIYSGAEAFENAFDDNALTYMCCSQGFGYEQKPRIVMRLADDCPEIVSVDIAQFDGDQTPNALMVEGSADGQSWRELASTNGLPRKGGQWHFATRLPDVGGTDPRRLSDGEGLGFAARAGTVSDDRVLENVNAYSVSPGATLTTEGTVSPVISRLRVDGRRGAGTISGGFRFAKAVTLDLVGAARAAATLPHGFAGVAGFGDVEWTVTFDGVASRYSARVTARGIEILPPGALIVVR